MREGKILLQQLQKMLGGLGCNLQAFCRDELYLKLLLDLVEFGLVLAQAFAPVPGSIKGTIGRAVLPVQTYQNG